MRDDASDLGKLNQLLNSQADRHRAAAMAYALVIVEGRTMGHRGAVADNFPALLPAPVVLNERSAQLNLPQRIFDAIKTHDLLALQTYLGPAEYLLYQRQQQRHTNNLKNFQQRKARAVLAARALSIVEWYSVKHAFTALKNEFGEYQQQYDQLMEIYRTQGLKDFSHALTNQHKELRQILAQGFSKVVAQTRHDGPLPEALHLLGEFSAAQKHELAVNLRQEFTQGEQPDMSMVEIQSWLERVIRSLSGENNENARFSIENALFNMQKILELELSACRTSCDQQKMEFRLYEVERASLKLYYRINARGNLGVSVQTDKTISMIIDSAIGCLSLDTLLLPSGMPALHLAVAEWSRSRTAACSNIVVHLLQRGASPAVKVNGKDAFADIAKHEIPLDWVQAQLSATIATTPQAQYSLVLMKQELRRMADLKQSRYLPTFMFRLIYNSEEEQAVIANTVTGLMRIWLIAHEPHAAANLAELLPLRRNALWQLPPRIAANDHAEQDAADEKGQIELT
jgi:hypothetical protein